jgi:hypothetical protein
VAFQADSFQGNAFQVGLAGAYPFTPATGTSYIEGLPDRTRIVFYQALAAAPVSQAATVTPITAGLQDVDAAHVPPFRSVQFQFATFTQNDTRAATPITAGIQDFDLILRRLRPPLPPDVISAYPQVVVTIFETEGFDDFDQIVQRRPRVPPQDVTFAIFTRAQTESEGFDDFDQILPRRPIQVQLFSGFATISGVIASTPITAGLREFFDQPARQRQRLLQDITSTVFTPASFETEGFDDFDQLTVRGRLRLLQDITFTQFTQAQFENEGWDDFDVLQPRQRRLPFWDITTSYPTAATATPTTAGVEPVFGPLFKQPFLDRYYATLGINTTVAAQTPITAGLQDFDYRFRSPFRPPQFTDFVTISGLIARTPITAGLQDFDRASFRRLGLQDFGASLVSQITAITAGLQDLDRVLRPRRAADPAQAFVGTPAAASVAGTQWLDAPARQRPPLAQWHGIAITTQATATPITAGLQDLDVRFIRPFRPALQQVTSTAPASIVLALTPGPFQYAIAALPPFHYGMKAHLQMFTAKMLERVVAKFIIQRPSPTGLSTATLLLGTKDVPAIAASEASPTLTGNQGQPGLAATDGETDLEGEVEG